jgi:metacaspase-1
MGQQQSLETRFRALLISPTYVGTNYYLDCTVNDAKGWYDFLVADAHVPPKCVRWLSDSKRFDPIARQATTQDILDELAALVKWAHATKDPVIFISYSGHGTQQKDHSGDEEDGKDEGWVPQDMGFVRDDYLNQEFLARLPRSCRVIAVNDACYNGTVWDACYTAQYQGKACPLVKSKSRSLD